MDVKEVVNRENLLQITVDVPYKNDNKCYFAETSPEFIIGGAVAFKVTLMEYKWNAFLRTLIFVKFNKHSPDDHYHEMDVSSIKLEIKNMTFTGTDGHMRLLHFCQARITSFDLKVQMYTIPRNSFSSLHEDTELTDFELRAEDGCVQVHRAVLAASSPVLQRMFGGKWRETTEGHIHIPGTSKSTLQHLKDYIYLHQLPDPKTAGLQELLLLSSYYIMPDLEQKCVDGLVSSLNAENACGLIEFGGKHKMTRLTLAILENVASGVVNVQGMKDHFLHGGGGHKEE